MGNTGQGSVVGTRKEQGEGGPGGLPVSGHWGGGEGWDTYLPPLAQEARASETKGGCVPITEAAAPPRTNASVLPKEVSHHSRSEGQALSLAHSRN